MYLEDSTLDVNYLTRKGLIIYDLLTDSMTHHVSDYLLPSLPVEHLLFSKYLTKIIYGSTVYDAKTGKVLHTTESLRCDNSADMLPVLLLDGDYMAAVTRDGEEVRLVNSSNGAEIVRFMLHGRAVHMRVGKDDRTIYVSTKDGRVLVLVTVLQLSDPTKMLVSSLTSRKLKL